MAGPVFTAFAHEMVAARNLSSYLVGVDLSGFDTSSAAQTYELFHTSVPMAEILTAVPEPGSMALCLVGLGCLGLSALRKSKAQA